jgi:hypothetical protein
MLADDIADRLAIATPAEIDGNDVTATRSPRRRERANSRASGRWLAQLDIILL